MSKKKQTQQKKDDDQNNYKPELYTCNCTNYLNKGNWKELYQASSQCF